MRTWMFSMLAAGTMLAAAMPAEAQTRPSVSSSESSRRSEPTCVVNGYATNCGGSAVGTTLTGFPGPVIVGISPVSPVFIPVWGGTSDGRASTDTDVDRSTRHGTEISR